MIQRLFIQTKNLTHLIKYNYVEQWDEHFVKPYSVKAPKGYQKVIRKTKQLNIYPKVIASFHDVLYMPGLDKQRLLQIQRQILLKGEVSISNQFIALLMYHLGKNKLMLQTTLQILQEWIPRHKGQYTARQVFGCLYGSLIYNRTDHIDFFLDQVKASNLQFQLSQTVQIIEALNKSQCMSLEEKHKFWEENFKQIFLDNLHNVRTGNIPVVLKIFDAFKEFQYYDEQIWDRIFIMMDNKGGWIRTKIIQRLYPLTGTFQKAKLLFDKYYTKLSTNRNIQWRYNLEQLRLYSSQQMIAKSQENINMIPSFRTMIPKERLAEMTARYENWLVHGNVKADDEIIRDKSASFGYAIKDRFEALTKDKVDFSKVTKKEFEELFGQYDEQTMKDKQEVVAEQPQGQETQEQNPQQ